MKAIIKNAAAPKILAVNLEDSKLEKLKKASEEAGAQIVCAEDQQRSICALLGESTAECADKGKYEDSALECLLFAGFDRAALNAFLDALKALSVKIALKAMYTPHNRYWSLAHLIDELAKEHRLMTGGDAG